ncbi:hypothetical protein CAPTEDRAFT_218242 [Capitella teleta]|uniref:Uncharacterized protein n=1 Tax=Capitella teleta TaxID=283909 RepID=R7VCY4_CAPTE|nr:hypothetical protein CAPTEDRAFT_218242 [Capitella teleta]|eukprot:ELU13545.1 hypothetical protein CAPTEDRAFT_218242 [Capitella teleta]
MAVMRLLHLVIFLPLSFSFDDMEPFIDHYATDKSNNLQISLGVVWDTNLNVSLHKDSKTHYLIGPALRLFMEDHQNTFNFSVSGPVKIGLDPDETLTKEFSSEFYAEICPN